MPLLINEDNELFWAGMVDNRDQTAITTATVTGRILDLAMVEVIGAIPMAYNSTLQEYLGIIDKAEMAGLTLGTEYYVEITGESAGRDGYRLFKEIAVYHGIT